MLTVEAGEASLADARSLVAAFAADRCPWADVEAVTLVVSELVANAIRHAGGWWQVTAVAGRDVLRVAVHDTSSAPLTPRTGALDGSGGWGLNMAHHLAHELSTIATRRGKKVCALWRAAPVA